MNHDIGIIKIEPLEQALISSLAWACGDDTGGSSRALLLSAITGQPPDPSSYPSDDGDRGRCVRMISKLPWAYPKSWVGWSEKWIKAWSLIERECLSGQKCGLGSESLQVELTETKDDLMLSRIHREALAKDLQIARAERNAAVLELRKKLMRKS